MYTQQQRQMRRDKAVSRFPFSGVFIRKLTMQTEILTLSVRDVSEEDGNNKKGNTT